MSKILEVDNVSVSTQSDDYYTEEEVRLLFGYSQKSSVNKYRNRVAVYKLSNRWCYLRSDIDALLEKKFDSAEGSSYLAEVKQQVKDYGLDFARYITMPEALVVLGVSRQRLYQLCDAGKIEWVDYDGFRLFDREVLEKRSNE